MKNILLYEKFCLNEQEKIYFRRHNMSPDYNQRAKEYNVSENPTVLGRVGNFFGRMEDRLSRMSEVGKQLAQSRRMERGPGGEGFNTGYELLFGLTTIVPGVLKRIFGPTKYEFTRKSGDDVNLELMRHTNEDFVREDLPTIKSETQLEAHVDDLYKRGGVKPGEHPVLDDIARNRANLYYEREINPNSPLVNPAMQPVNN